MTETQAKSGAAGASTDADGPQAEAPATTMTGTSDAPARPAEPTASTVTKTESPQAGSEKGKDGARSEGGEKNDAARAASEVPVVAVPAGTATGSATAGRVEIGSPGGDSRATNRAVKVATGTAPVVPASGSTPVIARAAVVPPTTGSASTVTGTGLRQATGSTPYVTTVTAPTRPGTRPVRPPDSARQPSRAAATAAAANRGPRRARLHLKRIDPWSVMKFSFAVSLVLFVVAIVATAVLYLALDAMNVWASLNTALSEVTGQAGTPNDSFRITAKGVIGTAVLLGAVNMVLFTALMTLGAFVYNVCADLVGGIELTLSEKD